ncbi:MAG: GNAT family N-acetyltransferase [Deltaproteobacteria bacterium]|nr:GNAT family N-acetyltransferase [Deltaproteobacteria bacterium]
MIIGRDFVVLPKLEVKMVLTLRPVTAQDFELFCSLRCETDLTPVKEKDYALWFIKVLRRKSDWIAEADGKPVGLISLDRANWIHIAVLPEHRKKGYGEKMLNMVPVKGVVWALIPNTNVVALQLFLKAGYSRYEFSGNYVIMQRKY